MKTSTTICFLMILATLAFTTTCVPQTTSTSEPNQDDASTGDMPREYPCRSGFTLYKRYRLPFELYYICEQRSRAEPTVTDRVCPEGYYESERYCYREESCDDCIITGCGTGVYRYEAHKDYCIYCPENYTLSEFGGTRNCFATFLEDPACPNDQQFSTTSGTCQ